METNIKIDNLIKCQIMTVKTYEAAPQSGYQDTTPAMEIVFKPVIGTGLIKQKIALKGYYNINDIEKDNGILEISTCEHMYLIDKTTKQRIENTEETEHIKGVLEWLLHCCGLWEGSLGLPHHLINAKVSLLIENGHIVGYDRY
jgi:hypothetical protein